MKDNKKLLKLPNISFPALNNQFSRKPLNIYFLNSIKNFKIKLGNAQTSLTTKNFKNGKNIKTQSIGILNISKKKTIDAKKHTKNKKKLKINPNFSFKNMFEIIKKNNLKKSASYNNLNTIDKEKTDFESNFMKLKNEANIYTSDVDYIKNSKMLLLDKYIYDNNRYKPDRLRIFDMSDFKTMKFKNKKMINGHIYLNHNKYQRIPNNETKY